MPTAPARPMPMKAVGMAAPASELLLLSELEPEPEPEVEADEVEASELYLSRSGRCCWDCFRWSCCIMTGESGSRGQGGAHTRFLVKRRVPRGQVSIGGWLVGRDDDGGGEKEG